MIPRELNRRSFALGAAAAAISPATGHAKGAQRVGDVIDVYDENATDFRTAYDLGARAVLHETNYFVRPDGTSAEYGRRKAAAKGLGLLWGAFMMMTDESVETQYNRLSAVEDFADRQTLFALDWEEPKHGKKRASYDRLRSFAELIFRSKSFYPLLYGSDFITENRHFILGDAFFAKCPLWIAAPNASAPTFPVKTWKRYALWQYQFDDPRLSKADWSRFDGSLEEMRDRWPLNGK